MLLSLFNTQLKQRSRQGAALRRWFTSIGLLSLALLPHESIAAAGSEAASAKAFQTTVQPFLQTYCISCHGHEKPKGDFDLSPYRRLEDVVQAQSAWEMILDRVESGEMPPKKAQQHPDHALRKSVVSWVQEMRQREAEKNAGDPGPVLARRLSNAEYDYTVRELTGVDLRPTREFPVDPANQEGFDNTGESLTMSPALVKKYLKAAREVADHLVFKPDGLDFAEHPMLADTDRDKYCVLRIVDFYKRQPTDLAAYFEAAWRYRHRAALGQPRVTLRQIAEASAVSPKYLELIWKVLNDPAESVGPLAKLQNRWSELPSPDPTHPESIRTQCIALRDGVLSLRKKLIPKVPNLTAPGINEGSQTLVLWKNRELAANRRRYDPSVLQWSGGTTILGKRVSPDPELTIPADEPARTRHEAAFARFCSLFPDSFYISERARVYLDAEGEKGNAGRLLSAGFHSMTGYFRDDAPLCELILEEKDRARLDQLWDEFDLISSVPQRMHTSFIWFERAESSFLIDAEFDFARAEDKDCTSLPKVRELAKHFADKARRQGAGPLAMAAIEEHFERVAANLSRVDQLRVQAEARHLQSLEAFASRAYRRPLTKSERTELVQYYRSLRGQDGLTHEDAIRDCVATVLMSPEFTYRVDRLDATPMAATSRQSSTSSMTGKNRVVPLSDHALASRLSYFLWSCPPDTQLLSKAEAGLLHRPEILKSEARRMLRDPRARHFAVEFGGHWLDFRRFEEHNAVDRDRFPTFNDGLRQAMFEEPVRFILAVMQEDRPVTDFLDADYTFVNAALAKHYGLPLRDSSSNSWWRVQQVRDAGRGGLLPMSVFLTANSPGLRTSPVKRGYWVARRVLGEKIPPPPAAVPQLPADESKLGELTLPETLARHRADASCAGCHQRFDSLGLVFEGYGPVGETRAKDLGGRPVDTRATFPDGSQGQGLESLRSYIRSHRQDDFLDNLCRKLLAYALGRSLLLSDELTVRTMRTKLSADGQRFGSLVESIVTSPQFLNKRAPESFARP